MPLQGIEEGDRPGQVVHDPGGLEDFVDEMRTVLKPPTLLTRIDAHINDAAFADKVVEIFDAWVADGTVTGAV